LTREPTEKAKIRRTSGNARGVAIVTADKEKYPRRDPSTAFRKVDDDGCLVVVPGQATVEVLNPVGGKIYSLLDGEHTVDDIVRELVAEFDVSEEQARRDVDAFLNDLRERKMLAVASSGAAE
jgi:hypothetical protein